MNKLSKLIKQINTLNEANVTIGNETLDEFGKALENGIKGGQKVSVIVRNTEFNKGLSISVKFPSKTVGGVPVNTTASFNIEFLGGWKLTPSQKPHGVTKKIRSFKVKDSNQVIKNINKYLKSI